MSELVDLAFSELNKKMIFSPELIPVFIEKIEKAGLGEKKAFEMLKQVVFADSPFVLSELDAFLRGLGFDADIQALKEEDRIRVARRPFKKLEPNSIRVKTTDAGTIQFRVPPNTVKTIKRFGEEPCHVFVLTEKSFHEGVNYMDISFPVFDNFFLRGGIKTSFLCTSTELAERARTLFQEELFGPTRDELIVGGMTEMEADEMRAEMDFFIAKNNEGTPLSLDDFAEFISFKDNKIDFGRISIAKEAGRDVFIVIEEGKAICRVDLLKWEDYKLDEDFEAKEPGKETEFGVYFFDPSTGFDPDRLTSSFIVWIGDGKALVVDPLSFMPKFLERRRIDPYDIEYIFLTHTHSDHDDGVVEQVLNGRAVKLLTSRVIMNSFVKKVRAITDWPQEDIERLIEFKELKKGELLNLGHGVSIEFDYAFHSVPTARFVVTSKGKRIAYSADTLYDSEKIEKMVSSGLISRQRADSLLGFIWDADLIIHDAGGGIHTAPSVLESLSQEIRNKLIVLHAPNLHGANIRQAQKGDEITLIKIDEVGKFKRVMQLIDRVPLFIVLSPTQKMEVLENARRERFEKNDWIVKEGSGADRFFIILSGQAEVFVHEQSRGTISKGEYFGEIALMELKSRSASVRARTTLELLSLDKQKFERYRLTIEETFQNILENRNYIQRVSLFKNLPGREVNSLAALFRSKEYKRGEAVIRQGEVGDKFYIVKNGLLQIFIRDGKGNERMTNEIGTEDFFGEIALLENVKRTADVRIASATAVLFYIDKATFDMLTGIYPGLNIRLHNEIEERKKRNK